MVKFCKTEIAFKIVPSCACIDGEVTKLELVSCPFYVRFRSTSTNLWLFRDLWSFSYDHIDSDFTTLWISHQSIFDPILTEFDHFWPPFDGNIQVTVIKECRCVAIEPGMINLLGD